LINLDKYKVDPRNWRPNITVFTDNIEKEIDMVYLANCLNQKRGFVNISHIIEGRLSREKVDIAKKESVIKEILAANNLSDDIKLDLMMMIMRTISKIGISTVITKLKDLKKNEFYSQIDIWWGGLENNGDMMLLLAHLIQMNRQWRKAKIILRSIVNTESQKKEAELSLSNIIDSVRIKAEAEVLVNSNNLSIAEMIKANTYEADLTFMGLMIPESGYEVDESKKLIELSEGLQSVVFVRNASEFSGKLL